MATEIVPTLADVEAARERLAGMGVRVTPVYSSETFTRMTGRPVHLKAENLQRTGAFKIRGAVNKIEGLDEEERKAGVITASAGNHGQAVAWAAREEGIEATVFMPAETPMAKVDATRNYGASVELTGHAFEEALQAAIDRAEATGAIFIHAFEDPLVIAGQGTIGLEIAEQVPDLETVIVPVGGGGLASGIALALRGVRPDVRIIGVQAAACAPLAGAAPSGYTIAEGIAVKHPGKLTSVLVKDLLDDIVTVTDEEISEAIVLLLERVKLVVEGAGAASVAALLAGKADGSGTALAILSGGNIDPTVLIQVMRHGLTLAGRYLVVRTRIPDRPGELIKLLSMFADEHANVVSIEHHREGMDVPVTETEVEATLLTRDQEHCTAILDAMRQRGYVVERLN
ncbi:MAG TPA: threonine ammonia-lyase [Gaiellaceae bacterium]|nr:threonine ammonia-lyase [Gaiellaceae bacterium]